MTDPLPPSLPAAVVDRPRRLRIPLVWIIPLVAALIGLFLAVRGYYEQGPTITIQFDTGTGLEPGKTRIKYRDVDVGQITAVALAEDGSHVLATAQLAREAARLLVDDTRFWVVSARVSGGSISGLDTLLSGAHVGMDVGKSAEPRRQFVGLREAPVVSFDVPGRSFSLEADGLGSIGVGTPVFYRRIQAGQVTGYKLDEQGKHLDIQVFVQAPYDRFVTANSRFWNASGVDVKLSAEGVQINTESATSILTGGLAFQTPDGDADEPVPKDHVFRLFRNRDEAFKQPNVNAHTYLLRFHESVRGLSVGAAVDFRGIQVGEVTAIHPAFHARGADLELLVEVAIFPNRLQARNEQGKAPYAGKDFRDKDFRAFIDRLIASGMRAQLRNGNLVTGQLYVALDFFPAAGPGRADWAQNPPQLPTQRGSLEELQTTLLRVVERIDKLPLDAIGKDTQKAIASLGRTLDEVEALVKRLDGLANGDVRDTIIEARGAIADTRKLLSSDAPLQQDLRASLQELSRAAQALRHLADSLDRHPEALLRGKPEDKP